LGTKPKEKSQTNRKNYRPKGNPNITPTRNKKPRLNCRGHFFHEKLTPNYGSFGTKNQRKNNMGLKNMPAPKKTAAQLLRCMNT
jgi:hypothetical protein